MTPPVIRGEALGKEYRRNEAAEEGLRHALQRALKSPLSFLKKGRLEKFWALKDVSLEVREGEVLGLIGRNGAGKTTLLKILSRITQPTTGWAEIHGRIGSLLEVGTGFHPELTGRENTFLSGAILGMSKREIASKFDEIVAFAELEKFIDTPVKHYSSGMYVRLAFAVAAHLQAEILLVDEVLAVGDIRFQKKCLGKMGDVARAGRTVILVSHNLAAISVLSTRVLMMKDGSIQSEGSPSEITTQYYAESLDSVASGADLSLLVRQGNGKAVFTSLSIKPLTAEGEPLQVAQPGCDLSIEVDLICRAEIADANVALIINDASGIRVIDTNMAQKGKYLTAHAGNHVRSRFLLHDVLLKPGKYFVELWLGRHMTETIDHLEHAGTFDVMEHADSTETHIDFPGVYLCRFEETTQIS